MLGNMVHLLFHNIEILLAECMAIIVRHIYRKVNIVADWVTVYIVEYFQEILYR